MLITRFPHNPYSNIPAALTIGNFDGVHLGHAAVLKQLVQYAWQAGLAPTVLTFEPHPKAFFAIQQQMIQPTKILPLRNKLMHLKDLGIEHVVVLPFDTRLAQMKASDFVEQLLVRTLNMHHLQVGDDFRFGAKRAGDFALLQRLSLRQHFSLQAHTCVQMAGQRISSSSIRQALAQGHLEDALSLLGHPLTLSGHIVYGQQLGRTIGCPTINLRMPHYLAAQGIYAVSVKLANQTYHGVASIGTRPSVKNNGECWLEVHILDFSQNVYGQLAHVQLLHKIRDEEKFDGLDALSQAIKSDIQKARQFFAANVILNTP